MVHPWLRAPARLARRILKAIGLYPRARRVDPAQTFCVLPWKHLQINPEGTAKICCRAAGSLCDTAGRPLSLDTHSFDEIWSSPHLAEVRRKMLAGEPLPECASCYAAEANGSCSYRTNSNDKWLGRAGLTVAQAIQQGRTPRPFAEDHPVFIQLNLGSLCNLKCRMCLSSSSSQIEADPVHSVWAPRNPATDSGLARWSGKTLVLRPGRYRDVLGPDGKVWSSGGAFVVPVGPSDRLTNLILQLAKEEERRELCVTINGDLLYRGVPEESGWPESFDLSDTDYAQPLEVRVEASGGGRVEVVQATLQRTVASARRAGFNNVLSTRFEEPGDWHTQDGILFDEILKRPDTLQELYFTGGEPLINKKFYEIIDYLIAHGVAERMTLQLNSNITKLTDALVDKLRCFRHVTFTLSIDGFGDVYEYIRFPAKWSAVADNAHKLRRLSNAAVCAIPVMTAYNVLSLTDLFRFYDELGIAFRVSPCFGPEWLMLHVLPPKVIELAACRFDEYAQRECRPQNRPLVQELAANLRKGATAFRPDLIPVFQAFTNDLDESRGQSFARTFPELVEMLADCGHPWMSGASGKLRSLGLPMVVA